MRNSSWSGKKSTSTLVVRVHCVLQWSTRTASTSTSCQSVVQGIIQLTIFKLQKNLQWIQNVKIMTIISSKIWLEVFNLVKYATLSCAKLNNETTNIYNHWISKTKCNYLCAGMWFVTQSCKAQKSQTSISIHLKLPVNDSCGIMKILITCTPIQA